MFGMCSYISQVGFGVAACAMKKNEHWSLARGNRTRPDLAGIDIGLFEFDAL